METRKVCIIGGGVIGLCSAYYALKRGYGVTIVQREPEGADNCSMGNAGMIVPSHFVPLAAPGMISKGLRWMLNPESPFFVRPRLDPRLARWGWLFYRHANERHVAATRELLRDLNLESRRLFTELEEEESFGLVRRGLLMLCKTARGLDEEAEMAEVANEIGVGAEVLDPSSVAKLDPGVTMDIAGAVHFPKDCHLPPERFMVSMRKRVLALGAEIVSGVEIDGLDLRGGRVVSARGNSRTFEADEFVIACGSWSAKMLAKLGAKLPLQPGKGYSLTLPTPPELPELCSIFAEAKVAITPMGTKLRFGGTMEVGSLDHSIDCKRVMGIVKSVSAYFPKFSVGDFADIEPWVGLRPVSPDGVPYLGRLKAVPNVVVATGHAMMGLSLGPITGRLVGDLLAGDTPFRPIDAMAPGRF